MATAGLFSCLPAGANQDDRLALLISSGSADASELLYEVLKDTDFLNHVPYGKTIPSSAVPTNYATAISTSVFTDTGSQIDYYCGVMSTVDGKDQASKKLVRVPALDSVTIRTNVDGDQTFHMFVMAAPNGAHGPKALSVPSHLILGLSDGSVHFYQFIAPNQPDSAQACISPDPGNNKTCVPISPFFLGGMSFRLLGWATRSCDGVLKNQRFSNVRFVKIGSREANEQIAERHKLFNLYKQRPSATP